MSTPDELPNSVGQTNQDNAKGWQTNVGGGTANVAETIHQHYYNEKPRKSGVPFQAPPLPRPYIDRPEIRAEVKAKLLAEEDTTPGTLVVSAIYGLGGIGKSVLATVLAHDEQVQARFPDGILWATLGQQPDLLPFLSVWMQTLGDYDYKPTTIEAATLHLRTSLYDKRALLVVDDVWNAEHMEPFRIGGRSCRVLVTTREARIPDADRYDMDVMTPGQSLGLLLQKAQCLQPTQTEQQQAAALAKEVGYLPLALELAGAQIADGVLWTELLEDLRAEVVRLEALDDPAAENASSEKNRKRLSLLASFNLSLRPLSPEQLQQFAWLGVLPEDVVLTQAMAATLWDITPRQAGAMLRAFWSKALLLPGVKQLDQKPTYRLHDLMHDLAKGLLMQPPKLGGQNGETALAGFGLTCAAAHSTLLARYRAKTDQGQWHTLPDDGYIHAHLTWHLEQAQQLETLHHLLQETTTEGRNGWYEACDRLGQTANFVMDVARAWQLAEQQYGQKPAQSIVLQLRYSLIATTLNSLAKNIPAKLMEALVEKGIWTPAQGLAYAQQAQESHQRAAVLQALAVHLPNTLLPIALEVTRSLQAKADQAEVLIKLAPSSPEVIPEALAVARSILYEPSRTEALSRLAPYLPDLIPDALMMVRSIQDEYARARALSELAPYLPTGVLSKALEVACSIRDKSKQIEALIGLAPYVPAAISKALKVARSIQDRSKRIEALIGLAPYAPGVIPEALRLAPSNLYGLDDFQLGDFKEVSVLPRLLPYLPVELLPKVLEVARSTGNESNRAEILSALAQYLPEVIPRHWK